jgi:alkanesulfonate monooxygenase SsuD/methylene tetrahydromethanopterin reductase-like flavin-dependent oxidoreductase (luciferase family)
MQGVPEAATWPPEAGPPGRRPVRFGLYVAPFGELADVAMLAHLAGAAEANGWDGFFIWDHVMTHEPVAVADPWIALTTIAIATDRVLIGAMVTPLARRRPWDVARQAAMIDRLSGGRLVFGAGLGGDSRRELTAFGEERNARARGALLDEALEVVVDLWRGEPVTRAGHYRLEGARVLPTPLQAPRPPIWLACVWPHRKPLLRAARYDGVFPVSWRKSLTSADLTEMMEVVGEHRTPDAGPFDIVVVNNERPDGARLADLAGAGTTWWVQGFGERPRLADVQAAVAAGPPQ